MFLIVSMVVLYINKLMLSIQKNPLGERNPRGLISDRSKIGVGEDY